MGSLYESEKSGSLEDGKTCTCTESRATTAIEHMAPISNLLSTTNPLHLLRLCILFSLSLSLSLHNSLATHSSSTSSLFSSLSLSLFLFACLFLCVHCRMSRCFVLISSFLFPIRAWLRFNAFRLSFIFLFLFFFWRNSIFLYNNMVINESRLKKKLMNLF